jgi:hypothetical protein
MTDINVEVSQGVSNGQEGVEMSYENLYLVKCVMDQRANATLHETEIRRMLREAGIDHRPRLIRRVRRWLYRLGRRLVALGRRLERFDASMEGHHPASQSQSARL